jgi:hypothetical protein
MMAKLTLYENVNFGGKAVDMDSNGNIPAGPLLKGASSVRINTREWVSFGVPGVNTPRLYIHGPNEMPNLHQLTKLNPFPGSLDDGHWGDEIENVIFGAAPQRSLVGNRDTVWPYAWFFRDANFQGFPFPWAMYIGVYRADHKDFPNDYFSSVIVPAGLKVRMWEHEGPLGQWEGRGLYREYKPGAHNIDPAFNDKCSFINIEAL